MGNFREKILLFLKTLELALQIVLNIWQTILKSQLINFRAKKLVEKCFYLGENPVVVTSSLYDDVTTTQFLVKLIYFKALKTLELALQIVLNIWQTILKSQLINFRAKKLVEKCFYLGENPVVVTLSLYDDVTTTQFLVKLIYFKALKTLELALQIVLNIWQTILKSQLINFRAKKLVEKCFYLGENPVVVTSSLYNDVTTTQFLVKLMYFKALKTLELALQIVLNIWQTILRVNLQIFVLKKWWKNAFISVKIPSSLHCRYTTM